MRLSYALENIRRIRSCPDIELRPITILVGRNSAGKSTFLRSLPLIRQSLETRSSAPILWFGHLVDFGDINTVIADDAEEKQAAFRFVIRDLQGSYRTYYFHLEDYYHYRDTVNVSTVNIRYVVGAIEDRTVLEAIEIELPEEDINVRLAFGTRDGTETTIHVNGSPVDFLLNTYDLRAVETSLFAPPRFVARTQEEESSMPTVLRPHHVLATALDEVFRKWATRKLSDETYWRETRRVLTAERFDEGAINKLADTATTVTFEEIYRRLLSSYGGALKSNIYALQRLARVFSVLEVAESELKEYFLNVGYLEPVRAAGERFYRRQELQVSEIVPNGSNFPMFLASLSLLELSRFSDWVKEMFRYGVRVKRTGGHISIELFSGSKAVNITDTGYGVSQLLPVLGMIWWGQRQHYGRGLAAARRHRLLTLAIEQPELHLHPEHQARLADVFVAGIRTGREARGKGSECRLVVETHSEALINRLGELVEQGDVDAKEIQIVIFSSEDDMSSATEIRLSGFDSTGALVDWPYGFFNYSK